MPSEVIKSLLAELNSSSSSIEASAVMTRDGLPIASLLSQGVDVDRLSAVSAAMLSLAAKASKELNRGELEQVLIHGKQGFVLMVQVGRGAVLAVVSKFDSKLGMLLHEAKQAAERIAKHIR